MHHRPTSSLKSIKFHRNSFLRLKVTLKNLVIDFFKSILTSKARDLRFLWIFMNFKKGVGRWCTVSIDFQAITRFQAFFIIFLYFFVMFYIYRASPPEFLFKIDEISQKFVFAAKSDLKKSSMGAALNWAVLHGKYKI